MKKENTNFETSDFYLACFLYSNNFKIVEVQKKSTDKRLFFMFKDKANREKLTNQFFNNEAEVKVKDFTNAINTIKSMIYNYKDK